MFTKLNLAEAHNLICMTEVHKYLTAFDTFQYLVILFNFFVFMGFTNEMFSDILVAYVMLYLNILFFFPKNAAAHTEHIRNVLTQLHKHKLYAKMVTSVFVPPVLDYFS